MSEIGPVLTDPRSPYFGQVSWFTRYHPEKVPSAIERYQKETLRVIGVLDGVLLAPAAAVYTAWLFPERVLGQRGALAGIAAYAAQALVWVYFFCASRRESQAMLSAARVIV